MDEIINRHERIAIHFSGGRDSIACLLLLQPHWEKLTVYWCNPGDAYPETLQIVEWAKSLVPNFVEVAGNQPAVIAEFGIPSDIVPVNNTPFGLFATGNEEPMIQDRYSCCVRSIMEPMHRRMVEDEITLVIRGQKLADRYKSSIRSGDVVQGVEYLFPIEEMTDRQVIAYLREQKAPIPRFYEVLDSAPDCMTCSAWWDKGEAKYLKRYHYQQYQEVQRRLDIINQAVGVHIAAFNKEVQ